MTKYTFTKLEKEIIESFSNYTLQTSEAKEMYCKIMNSINSNVKKRAAKKGAKNVLQILC